MPLKLSLILKLDLICQKPVLCAGLLTLTPTSDRNSLSISDRITTKPSDRITNPISKWTTSPTYDKSSTPTPHRTSTPSPEKILLLLLKELLLLLLIELLLLLRQPYSPCYSSSYRSRIRKGRNWIGIPNRRSSRCWTHCTLIILCNYTSGSICVTFTTKI